MCLMALAAAMAFAADDAGAIVDRGFETLGRPGSPWQLKLEPDGFARLEQAEGFKGLVLHVRDAACVQAVRPAVGLYEIAAIAWGSGELTLAADGIGERTQTLQGERAVYGYLFASSTAGFSVRARVRGEGYLRALSMRPATEEQAAIWERAQKSIRQFGFATVSPQRPSPRIGPSKDTDATVPLADMVDRVVLDEPLMNTGHVVNEQRLVTWLKETGFRGLSAAGLAEWMQAHVTKQTAYGSVAVLCRGISPANLLEGSKYEPLWLRYLRAGGRIVNVGDLPFYNYEYADVRPLMPDANERGMNLLGLDAGWHSPFWGQGGRPVTVTQAARDWGLANVDTSITGFPVEAVTVAFGTYTTAADGRLGASAWFRNVRSDAPWSGLVKLRQRFDGNDDTSLADVWRAATYVGRPVTVPRISSLPQSQAAVIAIDIEAARVKGREQWVRGERVRVGATLPRGVSADGIRFELTQGRTAVLRQTIPLRESAAAIELDTSPWSVGDYELFVTAVARGRDVLTDRRPVGIRYVPACHMPWLIWHQAGPNAARTAAEFTDIADKRLEVLLTRVTAADFDAAVREGMGFALRIDTNLVGQPPPDYETDRECFRMDTAGRPIATAYSGGRPSLGISHPRVRENARASIRKPLAAVGDHPAFRPFALCNDDYSIYYGWDYSPHVVTAFQRAVGRLPPRERPLLPAPGRVPDDHPWLQWFQWTLVNVDGGFNLAEAAAAAEVRPDVRLGPIPGAMQIPLVDLKEPAQYPPYNFGPNGFNLVASYYYNTFWQPIMTASFWMEVGRMGNRALPQWNMPDALGTAGYTRNNFFHYMLGGVSGLAYYKYADRSSATWEEMRGLGGTVRRIGPLQATLQPAARDIALLNSFSTGCFDPEHTLKQTYAYHNLMQAHYDVTVVAEEEIGSALVRKHRALVLSQVRWLRAAAFDAVARHAAEGGLVILDATVPFDVPGAKRIGVDLATGDVPPEGKEWIAAPRTAGLDDYGRPERIRAVAGHVATHVPVRMRCDDIRLVAARFTAADIPCTWFVNAQDGEEFMYSRERAGAGHPGARTPEKIASLEAWERDRMEAGPFEVDVVVPRQPGVPYDLVAMSRVEVEEVADGYRLALKMARFGGALVAWLPFAIRQVRLESPDEVRRGARVAFEAVCQGVDGDAGEVLRRTPGITPIELVLRDPAGRRHPPSGVHAMRDGTLVIEWTPARNDPPGLWTVAIRELFSGKRAERSIVLAP
jgi:hypothetical protein